MFADMAEEQKGGWFSRFATTGAAIFGARQQTKLAKAQAKREREVTAQNEAARLSAEKQKATSGNKSASMGKMPLILGGVAAVIALGFYLLKKGNDVRVIKKSDSKGGD